MGNSRGPRAAKLGALSPAKVSFGQLLNQLFIRVDASVAMKILAHQTQDLPCLRRGGDRSLMPLADLNHAFHQRGV